MSEVARTIADFAIAVVWQSGLVAAAALLAARLTRRASGRAQHAFLATALVLTALVPALAIFWSAAMPPSLSTAARLLPHAASASNDNLAVAVAVFYALAVAHAVLALAWASRRSRSLRANARPCRDPRVVSDVTVMVSDHVASPVTTGVFRPAILFPASLRIEDEALRAVVAHELAHVRRRDVLVQWVLEVATLAVAFHPLVRALKRRAAVAREIACDEAVAPALVEPRLYAHTLLSLASRTPMTCGMPAFGDVAALELRLLSLRDHARPRKRIAIFIAAAAIALLALFASQFRLDFFRGRRDLSGDWALDRNATRFGPIVRYELFRQTLAQKHGVLRSSQVRVVNGKVKRVAWEVITDGKQRRDRLPPSIDGSPVVRTATWKGDTLVLALATPGHVETVRAYLRDNDTLICDGELREPHVAGGYRFVFRRQPSRAKGKTS